MKKILLILLFAITFIKADGVNSYNEHKIDLYYANGIMMLETEAQAERTWKDRSRVLISNNPLLKEKIDDYNIAYNISHGRTADLWESFLQKSRLEPEYNVGYKAFKTFVFKLPYIGKPTEMLVTVAEAADSMVHDDTLNKQIEGYKKSIKDGNGVVVVAHSQGNLFTTEAYRKLDTWMKPYFHTIAVATPGNKIVKGANGVTFKNDIITDVPGAMNGNLNNPNRHDYYKFEKNVFGDIISEEYLHNYKSMKYHSFEYYLGYPVNEFALENATDRMPDSMPVREARQTNLAKDKILIWIEDKIILHDKEASQWKIVDTIDKNTKDHRIEIEHIKDPSIVINAKVFPFNLDGKLYQLKNSGDYVKASFGGTEILDKYSAEWVDKEDDQFYKLEGTEPVEYIEGEKTCKDSCDKARSVAVKECLQIGKLLETFSCSIVDYKNCNVDVQKTCKEDRHKKIKEFVFGPKGSFLNYMRNDTSTICYQSITEGPFINWAFPSRKGHPYGRTTAVSPEYFYPASNGYLRVAFRKATVVKCP